MVVQRSAAHTTYDAYQKSINARKAGWRNAGQKFGASVEIPSMCERVNG